MFHLGRHSYIAFNQMTIMFPEAGDVTIGNFCSIAEDCVLLLSGEHNTKNISTFPFDLKLGWEATNHTSFGRGNITIGNDVWLGKGVKILSGVTIGDGAVVGAYTMVRRNINPYEIWIGNPAMLAKKRFNDFEIKWLMKMKWWDWPDELIKEASAILTNNDVSKLVKFYQERIENVT
jgi:acetyltransferase-like isoleucine patch superfamily enzyme